MSINGLLTRAARPARFTRSSGLRWQVARMISTNSLAAFTQEVTRTRPALEPRPSDNRAAAGSPSAEPVAQRRLEAVPPVPSKPLPRGSLLDLRV